jgi:hypothetical protein
MKPHRPGKFWPWVRELIWEKAYELHAKDFYDSHEENITQPTRQELREDGYFHQAKLLVLRQINRQNRGRRVDDEEFEPPTFSEWIATEERR